MKTSFLPLSREGIAVGSELNLAMQVLMRVTAKATQCCTASVLVLIMLICGLSTAQPQQILAPPHLQTEVILFTSTPRAADGLCQGSKVLLKMILCITKRGKKAPKPSHCYSCSWISMSSV